MKNRVSRYTRDLHEQARRLVVEAAYEEARDQGWVLWMPATREDPGCWSRELDIELEDLHAVNGDLHSTVTVRLGDATVWEGALEFYVGNNDRLAISNMEQF